VIVVVIAAILDVTLSRHGGTSTPAPAAAATASASASPASPAQHAAQLWQQAAERAEAPAAQAYISMVEQTGNWQLKAGSKNKISGAGLRSDLVGTDSSFLDAQQALAAQKPYPPDPRALVDFQQSVRLYATASALTSAATYLPPGALRQQALLSVTRVRHLGDSVYDDANSTLKPLLPPAPPTPGLHFDPTPAVPTWATTPASDHCITVGKCASIAAGPPLEAEVLVASAPAVLATPATESLQMWQQKVRALAIPSAAVEARAVSGSSAATARAVSAALARAQAAIAAIPDPTDPTMSATFQLDLLVDAEAVRAAQEADLATSATATSSLRAAARTLAGIGDVLWDRDFGTRVTQVVPPS
jgi:hypothetical protein